MDLVKAVAIVVVVLLMVTAVAAFLAFGTELAGHGTTKGSDFLEWREWTYGNPTLYHDVTPVWVLGAFMFPEDFLSWDLLVTTGLGLVALFVVVIVARWAWNAVQS